MAAEYFKDLQRIARRLNQLDHADLAGKMSEDLDAIARLGLQPGEVGIDHPRTSLATRIPEAKARTIRREYKSYYPEESENSEEPRLSLDAMSAMNHARTEGFRLNHNYIGTEHILLGLLSDPLNPVAQILAHPEENGSERREKQHDDVLNLLRARSAVEFIVGFGDVVTSGPVGLSPKSRIVLDIARNEARKRKSGTVDSIDLFAGLVEEGDSIGMGILESIGIDIEKAKQMAESLKEPKE